MFEVKRRTTQKTSQHTRVQLTSNMLLHMCCELAWGDKTGWTTFKRAPVQRVWKRQKERDDTKLSTKCVARQTAKRRDTVVEKESTLSVSQCSPLDKYQKTRASPCPNTNHREWNRGDRRVGDAEWNYPKNPEESAKNEKPQLSPLSQLTRGACFWRVLCRTLWPRRRNRACYFCVVLVLCQLWKRL